MAPKTEMDAGASLVSAQILDTNSVLFERPDSVHNHLVALDHVHDSVRRFSTRTERDLFDTCFTQHRFSRKAVPVGRR